MSISRILPAALVHGLWVHGLLAAPPASAAPAAPAVVTEWHFTALLDGKPIGSHHFVLQAVEGGAASERQLSSVAQFEVKLLGFTAYRYRHEAQERWQGDCLASLTARTDDAGRVTEVRGQAAEGTFNVDVRPPASSPSPTGTAMGISTRATTRPTTHSCLMSFAYWHPALVRQRQLLDPGSGQIEPVQVTELPAGTLAVRGQPVAVRGWRVAGPNASGLVHPIDVWFAGDAWVGLDTTVQGGRRMSYRLM